VSAQDLLQRALQAEREGYERMLRGEFADERLVAARNAYLASYGEAPPGSWGRLIGALKLAVVSGEGERELAAHALEEVGDAASAPACYLRSLAQVVLGGEPEARSLQAMVAAGGAFERTAHALAAIAAGDREAYAAAVGEVLADFESRTEHLGAPVADTVLVLERLAVSRHIAAQPSSALLPSI
jgi:hypothetical protein